MDARENFRCLLDCVNRARCYTRMTHVLEGMVHALVRETVRYGYHLARELGDEPSALDERLGSDDLLVEE